MTEIIQQFLTGERALFQGKNLRIKDTVFDDGESPLKESSNIEIETSLFRWKYPLWYSKNITVKNCTWFDMARAGVWYTENISLENCAVEAPKNFRRCRNISMKNVSFSDAAETLWECDGVGLEKVTAKGDYFGMNSRNIRIHDLMLFGNYCFDGCKNVEISEGHLITKDAFWNCENVTIRDSFITGEYFGWNSKHITLINCTVESLQGFCYIEDLVMKNCRLVNTTLAFEYSTVDADIVNHIDSIKNPSGGVIRAGSIGEIIMEPDKVNTGSTEIITKE